jgi:predicted PurR-regulated permease PerM
LTKSDGGPSTRTGPDDAWSWFRRTLVVMAGIGLAIATWQLSQVLLLLFAAVLAGLMFHDFAAALQRWLKLPFGVALALAVLLPLTMLAAIFGLFGNLMVEQFTTLAQQLPDGMATVERWLRRSAVGRQIIAGVGGYAPEVGAVMGFAQSAIANIGSAATAAAVVLVGGIYLAAQPRLYLGGVMALMPPGERSRAEATLVALHTAVTAWLKGQAVGMAFVAIGTSIGLSLVGLPSAVAIGLVAGLCEFVPYLGVILVSLPAVAIGFSMGAETGVLTIVALVVVQQLQGNVVTPMAQGQLADLPPALTIFSLIGAGLLLGPLGVVLAVPLTVVTMVLVKAAIAAARAPATTMPAPLPAPLPQSPSGDAAGP